MKWNVELAHSWWCVKTDRGEVITSGLSREQAEHIAAAHNAYIDMRNDR